MNEQCKVSIIVAVYNVEKYIRRSLDSLAAQTHHNLEIILVDDGSKDNSGVICDEYASKDSRFRVIHKENGGVSKARQTGLDAATGDYVIHSDPDDYVDSKMIEELLAKAVETNADMTTCDFYLDGRYYEQHYDSPEELLKKLVDVNIICVCWNVLVKRAFIVDHNVRFTPDWLNQSEDFLFMSRLLVAGATAVHLNKAFYHYWSYNGNSLSNKRSKKKIESIIAVIKEFEKLVNPSDFDDLYTRKKYALMSIFNNRYFEYLNLYPEIYVKLSKDESSEELRYLLMAINGYPKYAYIRFIFYNYYNKFSNKIQQILNVFHK